MRTLIPIVIIVLSCASLFGDDKINVETTLTTQKEFKVALTNIMTKNEQIPAISLKIKQKFLNKFDFMIAYANSLFAFDKQKSINNNVENIHMQLSYKF